MRTTQQLSITLPDEMARVVKVKIKSGEYATQNAVTDDGVRTLFARDRAVESWLREQVAPAYDALKAASSRAIDAYKIRARLATKCEQSK